jgi:hypothetical protein
LRQCRLPVGADRRHARPIRNGLGIPTSRLDALRLLVAGAFEAGWAERSILASGRRERAFDGLETLVLGPLAQQR